MKPTIRIMAFTAIAALTAYPVATAHAQAGREELYQFRVPVHLTQLSPDLAVIIVECFSSLSPTMAPQAAAPPARHELKVVNSRIDTTVVTQLKIVVPSQDTGKQGLYTCQISGRRASDNTSVRFALGPTEANVAFRVTPALPQISKAFTW